MTSTVRAGAAVWWRERFPVLFFAAVALGTLPVIFTNLFVSSRDAFDGVAALQGREYAAVQLAAFDNNPLLIHAHAALGLLLVLTVPFQFWRRFRTKYRTVHRYMGYVAITCLVLLATSGVAVSMAYPFAGIAGTIPNVIWMCAILIAVGTAYIRIRQRDFYAHETWMTRAIAMTFGITFATLYVPLFVNILHVAPRPALAISFWLGVVECFLIGELWLRRPSRPRPRKR